MKIKEKGREDFCAMHSTPLNSHTQLTHSQPKRLPTRSRKGNQSNNMQQQPSSFVLSFGSYKIRVITLLFICITFFILEWEFQSHVLHQKDFTLGLKTSKTGDKMYSKKADARFIVSVLPIFQKSQENYFFPTNPNGKSCPEGHQKSSSNKFQTPISATGSATRQIFCFSIIRWLLLSPKTTEHTTTTTTTSRATRTSTKNNIAPVDRITCHSIGGWNDEATNRYYVDANMHFSSFQCAAYIAKKHKQIAIYDSAQCKSIPLDSFV